MLLTQCMLTLATVILHPKQATAFNISLIWWENAPYVFRAPNGSIRGLVTKIFEPSFVRSVCNVSAVPKLVTDRECKTLSEFVTRLNEHGLKPASNDSSMTIFLPGYTDSEIGHRHKFKEIPLAKSPGMSLVSDRFLRSTFYQIVFLGFNKTKIVLTFIFIAMVNVAIGMWICERHLHDKGGDFRDGMLKGVWDGLWWAAVTLTTVGYGDKTPKSNCGRFIGFLWLFISAAILSGFTALLTTAVNSSKSDRLLLQPVVTIKNSPEASYVQRKGGAIIEMESVEAALRRAEQIDTMGALLDTNTVAYYQYELPDRKLFVNGFFERVKKVLMLIPKEDAASHLVSDYISCIENNLSHSLENEINSLKKEHEDDFLKALAGKQSRFPFFPVAFGITGFMILAGIAVEVKRLISWHRISTVVKNRGEHCEELHEVTTEASIASQLKQITNDVSDIKAALRRLENSE